MTLLKVTPYPALQVKPIFQTTNTILYEDNHVIVVNKQAGQLVQSDKTGDLSILEIMKAFIKERDEKPGKVFLGLPHRLDRPTSGALILAKTSKALSRLSASFRNGEVNKVYWAVTESLPEPPEGILKHWLKKDERMNTSRCVSSSIQGSKFAHLSYSTIGKSKRYWLLEINLFTGRHHQIRVQLSSIGCNIKGDLKYGAKRSNPSAGIHLHARKLQYPHPIRREPVTITAPLPSDPIWQVFS